MKVYVIFESIDCYGNFQCPDGAEKILEITDYKPVNFKEEKDLVHGDKTYYREYDMHIGLPDGEGLGSILED